MLGLVQGVREVRKARGLLLSRRRATQASQLPRIQPGPLSTHPSGSNSTTRAQLQFFLAGQHRLQHQFAPDILWTTGNTTLGIR